MAILDADNFVVDHVWFRRSEERIEEVKLGERAHELAVNRRQTKKVEQKRSLLVEQVQSSWLL